MTSQGKQTIDSVVQCNVFGIQGKLFVEANGRNIDTEAETQVRLVVTVLKLLIINHVCRFFELMYDNEQLFLYSVMKISHQHHF